MSVGKSERVVGEVGVGPPAPLPGEEKKLSRLVLSRIQAAQKAAPGSGKKHRVVKRSSDTPKTLLERMKRGVTRLAGITKYASTRAVSAATVAAQAVYKGGLDALAASTLPMAEIGAYETASRGQKRLASEPLGVDVGEVSKKRRMEAPSAVVHAGAVSESVGNVAALELPKEAPGVRRKVVRRPPEGARRVQRAMTLAEPIKGRPQGDYATFIRSRGSLLEKYKEACHLVSDPKLVRLADDAMAIHVVGDPFAQGSGLEGSSYGTTLKYAFEMLDAWSDTGSKGLHALRDKIGAALRIEKRVIAPLRSVGREADYMVAIEKSVHLLREHIQKELQEGRSVVIPGGWRGVPAGHAMLYELIGDPAGSGTIKARLYNSGTGIAQYHGALEWIFKDKYLPFYELEGIDSAIIQDDRFTYFLRGLLEAKSCLYRYDTKMNTNYTADDAYGLFALLGGKPSPISAEMTALLMNPQQSGTCAWRSIVALMKADLTKEEYTLCQYRSKLQTLVADYENSKNLLPNEPLKMHLLKQSIQKFSNTVMRLQESGLITKKEGDATTELLLEIDTTIEAAKLARQNMLQLQAPTVSIPDHLETTLVSQKSVDVTIVHETEVPTPPLQQEAELLERIQAWQYRPETIANDLRELASLLSVMQRAGLHDHVSEGFIEIMRKLPVLSSLTSLKSVGEGLLAGGQNPEDIVCAITNLSEIFFQSCHFSTVLTNLTPSQWYAMAKASHFQDFVINSVATTSSELPPLFSLLRGALSVSYSHCGRALDSSTLKPSSIKDAHVVSMPQNMNFRIEEADRARELQEMRLAPFSMFGVWGEESEIVVTESGQQGVREEGFTRYLRAVLQDSDRAEAIMRAVPYLQGKSLEEQIAHLLTIDDATSPLPATFLARRKQFAMMAHCSTGPVLTPPGVPQGDPKSIHISYTHKQKTAYGGAIKQVVSPSVLPKDITEWYPEIRAADDGSQAGRFGYWQDAIEDPDVRAIVQYLAKHGELYENEILLLSSKELGVSMSDQELRDVLKIMSWNSLKTPSLLAYFSGQAQKLAKKDWRTFFTMVLFDDDTLSKAVCKSPELAQRLSQFVASGIQMAKEDHDVERLCFYARISDALRQRGCAGEQAPQKMLWEYLSTAGKGAELSHRECALLSAEILSLFHDTASFTREMAEIFVQCRAFLNCHPLTGSDASQKRDAEISAVAARCSVPLVRLIEQDGALRERLAAIVMKIATGAKEEVFVPITGRVGFGCLESNGVLIDLVAGAAYTQGGKVQGLPGAVTQSAAYRAIFGSRVPSRVVATGNTYTFADEHKNSYEIIHGRGKEVTIRVKLAQEGKWRQYIPRHLLADDIFDTKKEDALSSRWLVRTHLAWANCDTPSDIALTDDEGHIGYRARLTDNKITKIEKCDYKGAHGLVQPLFLASGYRIDKNGNKEGLPFLRAFSRAEDLSYIHLFADERGGPKLIELPRFALSFVPQVVDGRTRWQCRERPGFFLASEQHIPPLAELEHYLVLESAAGKIKGCIPDFSLKKQEGEQTARTGALSGTIALDMRTQDLSVPLLEIDYQPTSTGYRTLGTRHPETNLVLAKLFLAKKQYDQASAFLDESLIPVAKIEPRYMQRLAEIVELRTLYSDNFESATALRLKAACLQLEMTRRCVAERRTEDIPQMDWEQIADDLQRNILQRNALSARRLQPHEERMLLEAIEAASKVGERSFMTPSMKRYLSYLETAQVTEPRVGESIEQHALVKEVERLPKWAEVEYAVRSSISKAKREQGSKRAYLVTRPGAHLAATLFDVLERVRKIRAISDAERKAIECQLIASRYDTDIAVQALRICLSEVLNNPQVLHAWKERGDLSIESVLKDACQPLYLGAKLRIEASARHAEVPEDMEVEGEAQKTRAHAITDAGIIGRAPKALKKQEATLPQAYMTTTFDATKYVQRTSVDTPKEVSESLASVRDTLKGIFQVSERDSVTVQEEFAALSKGCDERYQEMIERSDHYVITEDSFVDMKEALPSHVAQLKGNLLLLEQAVLDVGNAVPEDAALGTKQALEKLKGTWQPLEVEDFLFLYGAKKLATLVEKRGMTPSQIEQLEVQIGKYATLLRIIQRHERMLGELQDIEDAAMAGASERQELINRLGREVYADPPCDRPEIRAFECFCNIQVRQDQLEVIDRFMRSGGVEGKDIIVQMIMGAGKSSVIAPILALLRADGHHLSTMIVPDSLFKEFSEQLRWLLGGGFAQKVMPLQYDRNQMTRPEYWEGVDRTLGHIQDEQSCLVLTPAGGYTLPLNFVDIWRSGVIKRPQDRASAMRALTAMRSSMRRLRACGLCQIEEADWTLNTRKEMNWRPSGSVSQPMPGEEGDAICQLYEVLLQDMRPFSFDFLPAGTAQGSAPYDEAEYRRAVLPKLAETFLRGYLEGARDRDRLVMSDQEKWFHYLTMPPSYTSPHALSAEDRRAFGQAVLTRPFCDLTHGELHEVEAFLRATSDPKLAPFRQELADEQAIRAIYAAIDLLPKEMQNALACARQELHVLLPMTLSKTRDEPYALSANPDTPFAIPAANGSPLEGSQFASCHETMNFTIQAVLFNGVSSEMFERYLDSLAMRMNEEREKSVTAHARFARQEYLSLFPHGTEPRSPSQLSIEQKAAIRAHINSSLAGKIGFVKRYLAPFITFTDRRIPGTPSDLAGYWHGAGGFSGTRGTAYPQRFAVEERYDIDAKTLFSLMEHQSPVQTIQVAPSDPVGSRIQALCSTGNSLIDIGGTLNGYNRREVAERALKEVATRGMRAVVYHNERHELRALFFEQGKMVERSIALCDIPMHERFSIYFQPYTTGSDIKHPIQAHARATITRNTSLRDLLQGVWRMRNLLGGQTIGFAVDADTESYIRKQLGISLDQPIEVAHLIRFCALNQANQKASDKEGWLKQELTAHVKRVLWDAVLDDAFDMTHILDAPDEVIDTLFCPKAATTAFELYGGRQLKRSRDVVMTQEIERLSGILETIAQKHSYFREQIDIKKVVREMQALVSANLHALPPTMESGAPSDFGKMVEQCVQKEVAKEVRKEVSTELPTVHERYRRYAYAEGKTFTAHFDETRRTHALVESTTPMVRAITFRDFISGGPLAPYAQLFDKRILITNNLAPTEAVEASDRTVQPFERGAKAIRHAALMPAGESDFRIVLIDQEEAANVISAMGTQRLVLWDSALGVIRQSERAILTPEMERALVQVKVLAGESRFSPAEQKILKEWLPQESDARAMLIALYEKEILKGHPDAAKRASEFRAMLER